MSVVKIRAALEATLDAMSPALSTARENVAFSPVAGTPFQYVNILFSTPDNSEFGSNYIEQGYMQVTLKYPLQTGSGAAAARAELIRSTFKRGNSFASGGVTTTIERTPEIGAGMPDGDRWSVVCKIRFSAQITA